MPTNHTMPPVKVPELTVDQLDLVHGGIIIVGGLVARSSFGAQTFSGLMNSARGYREAL
jgi:hypothetical protein